MTTRIRNRLHAAAVGVLFALLACTGSEHGNPEAPMPPDGGKRPPDGGEKDDGGFGNDPGDLLEGACERAIWLQPEDERARYRCEPVNDNPFFEGATGWQCTCGQDGETPAWQPQDGGYARCEQVLAETCGIDLDQRNFCEHAGGTCWPSPTGDDTWDCGCGEHPEASALASIQAESCEAAAFAHCATPCEDLTGQCTPASEADRFDCSCDYFSVARDTPAASCELALAGCNPQLNDVRDASGLACSSFAGFCDEVGSELRCSCADGSDHTQPLADLDEHSAEACDGALTELCGNGLSQRAAFHCALEKDAGRTCSASLRFADGRYDCHCESLDACNAEYDTRDSDLAASSCEEALSTCSSADDAQAHPAAPECAPDPGPRTCDGAASDGRRCDANFVREGRYHCQCFLDDGQTEVDIRDQELDAEDCHAALGLCVDLDARP